MIHEDEEVYISRRGDVYLKTAGEDDEDEDDDADDESDSVSEPAELSPIVP